MINDTSLRESLLKHPTMTSLGIHITHEPACGAGQPPELNSAGRLRFDLERSVLDVLSKDFLAHSDRPLDRTEDHDITHDIVDP